MSSPTTLQYWLIWLQQCSAGNYIYLISMRIFSCNDLFIYIHINLWLRAANKFQTPFGLRKITRRNVCMYEGGEKSGITCLSSRGFFFLKLNAPLKKERRKYSTYISSYLYLFYIHIYVLVIVSAFKRTKMACLRDCELKSIVWLKQLS